MVGMTEEMETIDYFPDRSFFGTVEPVSLLYNIASLSVKVPFQNTKNLASALSHIATYK